MSMNPKDSVTLSLSHDDFLALVADALPQIVSSYRCEIKVDGVQIREGTRKELDCVFIKYRLKENES